MAANKAADAANARGFPIDVRLQDIPARVQEIALHGIRHGAVVALTAAQVQTGHDLHTMEVGFPTDDGPEGHEDLIEDFIAVAGKVSSMNASILISTTFILIVSLFL